MELQPVSPPTIPAAPATSLSPSLTEPFPSVPVANTDAVNLSSFSYFRHSTDFFSDGYTKAPQIWGRTLPPSIILPAGNATS